MKKENVITETQQDLSVNADTATAPPVLPEVSGNGLIGGKFKTVDALLASYNNLQTEFSRRNARLKELEAQVAAKSESDLWEQKLSKFFAEYPYAINYGEEIGDFVASHIELIADDYCLEKALLAVMGNRSANGNGSASAPKPQPKADGADDVPMPRVTDGTTRASATANTDGASEDTADNSAKATAIATATAESATKNAENPTKAVEPAPKKETPTLLSGAGSSPVLPPCRPRTVKEASSLAYEILTRRN